MQPSPDKWYAYKRRPMNDRRTWNMCCLFFCSPRYVVEFVLLHFFFCKLSWGPLIFVSVYFLLPCFVCLVVFLFVCKICYFCFSLVLLLFLPFFIVGIVLSVFLWNTTFNYLFDIFKLSFDSPFVNISYNYM